MKENLSGNVDQEEGELREEAGSRTNKVEKFEDASREEIGEEVLAQRFLRPLEEAGDDREGGLLLERLGEKLLNVPQGNAQFEEGENAIGNDFGLPF